MIRSRSESRELTTNQLRSAANRLTSQTPNFTRSRSIFGGGIDVIMPPRLANEAASFAQYLPRYHDARRNVELSAPNERVSLIRRTLPHRQLSLWSVPVGV